MSHLCSEWNQAMSSQSPSGCSVPNNWLRGSSESWSDFTSLLEPIRDNRADSFAQLCHARFTGSTKPGQPHFVIPRSALPLLHGQFKLLGRIFCEERGHVLGKLCAVDRDIDFIVPNQAQAIEIACSDRRPLSINGAGLRMQPGIAVAEDAHTALQAIVTV